MVQDAITDHQIDAVARQPGILTISLHKEGLLSDTGFRGTAATILNRHTADIDPNCKVGSTPGSGDGGVAEGCTGKGARRPAEGTAGLCSQCLREAFKETLLSRIGYMLARSALSRLRQRLDPRRYNGAMFLGLHGVVVTSHGAPAMRGFPHALRFAPHRRSP